MIPPNSPAPSRQQIACAKKRRPKAPLLAAISMLLERVLYAERESGHVRACDERSRGTAADGVTLRRRAGDVVVVRAHRTVPAVVDLGVSDVHLGALGHDIVIAYDRHLRLDAAGCVADHHVDRGAALAALALAVAPPDGAGTGVDSAVHNPGGHLHPAVVGGRTAAASRTIIVVFQLLVSRTYLAEAEIPFAADLKGVVFRIGIGSGGCARAESFVAFIPRCERQGAARIGHVAGIVFRLLSADCSGGAVRSLIVGQRGREPELHAAEHRRPILDRVVVPAGPRRAVSGRFGHAHAIRTYYYRTAGVAHPVRALRVRQSASGVAVPHDDAGGRESARGHQIGGS